MRALGLAIALLVLSCQTDPVGTAAEEYVELLRAGSAASADHARSVLATLDGLEEGPRAVHLKRQLEALATRLERPELGFDEESRILYGIVAPEPRGEEEIFRELDRGIPGEGPLRSRLLDFQESLLVPKEKLRPVLERAIAETRERAREHVDVPEEETLRVEYVRGKAWPAFTTYLGEYESLLEVNLDFPFTISKVVEIAAHEAYPGHHLASVLIERDLVRGRGLVEYSVEPTVGPDALVREGLAAIAVELVIPDEERLAFERDVLYPLAGLDSAKAEMSLAVDGLLRRLEPYLVEGARRYLDGEMDRVATVLWLEEKALVPDPWAFLRFVDRERSYVVTYTEGAAIARRRLFGSPDPWKAYAAVLSSTHET